MTVLLSFKDGSLPRCLYFWAWAFLGLLILERLMAYPFLQYFSDPYYRTNCAESSTLITMNVSEKNKFLIFLHFYWLSAHPVRLGYNNGWGYQENKTLKANISIIGCQIEIKPRNFGWNMRKFPLSLNNKSFSAV